MRGYMQDGLQLAVGDRDSERQAISSWVTELGEFEASVRRSDVERLEAFLSKLRIGCAWPTGGAIAAAPHRFRGERQQREDPFRLDRQSPV